MSVVFEFYGVARLRAGLDRIAVRAETAGAEAAGGRSAGDATLGAALAALERSCPGVSGSIVEEGRLSRHFRLSLNGRQFVSDPQHALAEGDTLIVLSAEVGG